MEEVSFLTAKAIAAIHGKEINHDSITFIGNNYGYIKKMPDKDIQKEVLGYLCTYN